MFLPVVRIGNLWNRSPFLSSKNVHILVQDKVRRLTSESTSAFKKKNDTAYTNAKFVYLLCDQGRQEGEGRGWNAREKINYREDKTVSGKMTTVCPLRLGLVFSFPFLRTSQKVYSLSGGPRVLSPMLESCWET